MVNRYEQINQVQAAGTERVGQKGRSVQLGNIGDILSGTLVQGGDNPVVRMNGTDIGVKSEVLSNIKPGSTIHLKITGSSDREVTMKLVGAGGENVGNGGVVKTDIANNTAHFVEEWNARNEAMGQAKTEDVVSMMETLSSEERAQLKRLGIEPDSANSTLVKALVAQMRGKERKEDLEASIRDIREQIALEQGDYEKLTIRVEGDTKVDVDTVEEEAQAYLPLSENQSVYLMQNHMNLTLEHLYMARYAGESAPGRALSEADYKQMLPQIEQRIREASLEVNDSTKEAAKFLLEHELPVDVDNLRNYQAIREVNEGGFNREQIRENLAETVAYGILAGKTAGRTVGETGEETKGLAADASASVEVTTLRAQTLQSMELFYEGPAQVADRMQEDVSRITDESFRAFSETGLPYTLANLSAYAVEFSATVTQTSVSYDMQGNPGDRSVSDLSELTAYRQLEEIRLKMTWEASYSAASQDIHLRARELGKVVQALRDQEQNLLNNQMREAGIALTPENRKLAGEVQEVTRALPKMPAAAVGAMVLQRSFTIQTLHGEGEKALTALGAKLSDRVASYETLMTAPRSDMGDSIRKAFRNVDAILQDMNLVPSEENARAVRILGYNSMEITQENVTAVKVADYEVQQMLTNLTPQATLTMIRDGVNPLTMPIDELNAMLRGYMEEPDGAREEKYSDYLYRLEQRGEISDGERQSFIGVYRLLDKVVRSEGREIGALVEGGQALTLKNLLSAHRSRRASGMELTAADGESIAQGGGYANSISTQIEQGLAQVAYQQQLAGRIYNNLTPELAAKILDTNNAEQTLEEFCEEIKDQLTGEGDADAADAYVEQMTEDMTRDMQANLTKLQQMFAQYEVFPSATNLVAAQTMLTDGAHFFKEAEKLAGKVSREKASKNTDSKDTASKDIASEDTTFGDMASGDTEALPELTSLFESLPERLHDAASMEEAYGEISETLAMHVHASDAEGQTRAVDIRALKQIQAGFRLMRNMARRHEFRIPIQIEGDWNMMNLSVVEGSGEPGHIGVSMETELYGRIEGKITYEEGAYRGTVSAESDAGVAKLTEKQEILSEGLSLLSETEMQGEAPTTEELYHVARNYVGLLKRVLR